MDFRPLIRETLKIITFVGLNPFCNTLIYSVIKEFINVATVCSLIDYYVTLALTYRGIDSTMEVLIVVAISQVTIKMLFFYVNSVELKLVINNTNMFWKRNFIYFEQEQENEKIFSFAKLCMRLYIVLSFSIVSLYLIKPLFLLESHKLPWMSNGSRLFSFTICYAYEAFQLVIFVPIIIGFDFLFISLTTNIICEFKLLKMHFPNLSINPMVRGTDKEAMDELKKLVDHHNLILQCVKIMKQVYSAPLLGLFLWNMFGTCFSLIVATSKITPKAEKLQCGILLIYYILQLSFYCVFGNMLADESVKITNEVYNSKWWIKTQPELRKALVMVMRRANRPEILTAGGLLPVNLETFTMVLKHTFSFFTFIQVMYDK